MAYWLLYHGLGFTRYKLRFLSSVVKIFERIEVNKGDNNQT